MHDIYLAKLQRFQTSAHRLAILLSISMCVSGLSIRSEAKTRQTVVQNAGVPGQNSLEGRNRFEHDVLALHPQVVLIYFGMNDAVNEPKMLTPEQYIENLAWMVDAARAAKILVIVSSIQHLDTFRVLQRHSASAYGDEGPNGRIDRFNTALRKFAAEQNVILSDFSAAFDAAGGPTLQLSSDGVHLYAPGYALLAETFLQAIPRNAPQARLIVTIGDSLTYGTPLRTSGHDSLQTYPAVLQSRINADKKRPPSTTLPPSKLRH